MLAATACGLVVLASCVVSSASAQTAQSEFDRGVAALHAARNQEAAEAFEASYRLERLPRALLNLGIAYTKLGHYLQALDALDSYVVYADPETDAQNISAVMVEITRLHGVVAAASAPKPTPSAAPAPLPATAPPAATFTSTPKPVSPPSAARVEPAPKAAAQLKSPKAQADASEPVCALDDVCLGPVLILGIPNAIGGGVSLRFGDYFGADIAYQVLPTISVLSLGSIGGSLFSLDGRLYPFGGSFFLSGGFSYQAFHGTVDNGTISAEASADIPSFSLGIGFFGHDGFVMGIDLSLLIPLGSRSAEVRNLTGAPAGATAEDIALAQQDAKKAVEDVVDFLPVLVQLNVLRVAFLF